MTMTKRITNLGTATYLSDGTLSSIDLTMASSRRFGFRATDGSHLDGPALDKAGRDLRATVRAVPGYDADRGVEVAAIARGCQYWTVDVISG